MILLLTLGASANDTKDGDITSAIVISGKVDTSKADTYTITYKVTNSSGNSATVKRTVIVSPPADNLAIILKGANPLQLNLGGSYTEPRIYSIRYARWRFDQQSTGNRNSRCKHSWKIYTNIYSY